MVGEHHDGSPVGRHLDGPVTSPSEGSSSARCADGRAVEADTDPADVRRHGPARRSKAPHRVTVEPVDPRAGPERDEPRVAATTAPGRRRSACRDRARPADAASRRGPGAPRTDSVSWLAVEHGRDGEPAAHVGYPQQPPGAGPTGDRHRDERAGTLRRRRPRCTGRLAPHAQSTGRLQAAASWGLPTRRLASEAGRRRGRRSDHRRWPPGPAGRHPAASSTTGSTISSGDHERPARIGRSCRAGAAPAGPASSEQHGRRCARAGASRRARPSGTRRCSRGDRHRAGRARGSTASPGAGRCEAGSSPTR